MRLNWCVAGLYDKVNVPGALSYKARFEQTIPQKFNKHQKNIKIDNQTLKGVCSVYTHAVYTYATSIPMRFSNIDALKVLHSPCLMR
ncbi:hypothetical protein GCM10028827_32370 [Mucilaginibacter myungsuensis]